MGSRGSLEDAAVQTILVVEDDRSIALGLEKNLRYEGFKVLRAEDGQKGLEMAIDARPDLVLLDVMLPKVSGLEVCRTLRKNEIFIPVILLTARDQEVDKVTGLEYGADDYITKPFGVAELVARVKAHLRRKKVYEGEEIASATLGDAVIDFAGQTVTVRGKQVETSLREFELLKFLIRNKNKALSREEILNKVWGYDYYGTQRTIDNFITKLRRKFEKDPDDPKFFLTVRGMGYKLAM
jgi:two-component system, OmpR family, alkaline phosphatase synthesis response regulator PhoP